MSQQNSIFGSSYKLNGQYYPYYSYQLVPQFQCIIPPVFNQFSFYNKNISELNLDLYANLNNPNNINIKTIQSTEESQKKTTIEKSTSDQKKQKIETENIRKEQENEKIAFCQCSKSHCIKSYCFCFKSGQGCGDKCTCLSCKNTQASRYEKRHYIKNKEVTCNCTRSQCKKKYCQCYAAGNKCGQSCRCSDCQN